MRIRFNPICKDKFHWTAVDKERPSDGLLTKAKLGTWKICVCVV